MAANKTKNNEREILRLKTKVNVLYTWIQWLAVKNSLKMPTKKEFLKWIDIAADEAFKTEKK